MASALHLSRDADSELARRVGAGDVAAFATLDERHRRALTRYAGTLLRRSEHDAEDIVQDVLIRALDALRAGHVPDELRPWLFRLTRNRAIDEVRRKRWGDEALDPNATVAAVDRGDPEAMLSRKESIRRLVADLADLPIRQRTALLARELDGVVVLESDVHHSGAPAPFRLAGIRDAHGRPVKRGVPIPTRTAVVTALVSLPARESATAPPTVTLDCPDGMRFIGYAEPERRTIMYWQAMRETIPGYSTKVRIDMRQFNHVGARKGTIGIICKRPDANGSTAPHPRKLRPGERLAHLCTTSTQVLFYHSPRDGRRAMRSARPGPLSIGVLGGGEPVAIQRRDASGRWTRIGHDPGLDRFANRPGWVRTSQLCP